MHICVDNLSIIGSDNGLSPGRRQAIIWTNAGISLIGISGTNFSEILIGIQTFSIKKMHLKTSSAKWRPFCLGLNVLVTQHGGYSTGALLLVGLRPVIQILCHVLARGWGRWLRYFTEAKAEVKYRASARIRGPKHDTRFEWPVSILIMTRHPFLPFKTHKTSAKNPCLLTITGANWFCRYHQCTPSQLWMHPPVAKECRLMTSRYPIFDRTDNLNP